jgi:hypothetical protein
MLRKKESSYTEKLKQIEDIMIEKGMMLEENRTDYTN